jgi:hypothetical protein
MNSRVFFISSNRFDVSAAEKFGEITYLFDNPPSPFALDKLISELLFELQRCDFDPNVDFIAMTGPTIQLVSLFVAVVNRYGRVRSLIFDARMDGYRERVMNMPA